jgi:hypothetical protein
MVCIGKRSGKKPPTGSGLMIQPGEMKTRFSAGPEQRRSRRDGHHTMLPSIFDPTKESSDPLKSIYKMN